MKTDWKRLPDQSETGLLFLWNTSYGAETEFVWVCEACTSLVSKEILSLRVPRARCSDASCVHYRNYRVRAARCRPIPSQYGVQGRLVRRLRAGLRSGGAGGVWALAPTTGWSGTCFRVFKYLYKLVTYSLILRSSASDWLRRVSVNCRLRSVLATASAGLCSRLYSRSNSSNSTNFFADCIISLADCRERLAPEAAEPSEIHPSE